MITQEQAKELMPGDIVHRCPYKGQKCEVWTVKRRFGGLLENYWLVEVRRGDASSAISKARQEEWHLPGQCSPPSRQLTVEVRRVWDGKQVGYFFISMDDTEEFLQRNAPILLRGAQILAQESLRKD